MTQTATVQRILSNGMAEIAVPRKSACGHDCEECAGCGMSGSSVLARAQNPIGAVAGEKVIVETSTKQLLGIVALVYSVPLVLFLVGYFASEGVGSESVRYAIAIVSFFLGMLPAIIVDRRMKKTGSVNYTIVRSLSI